MSKGPGARYYPPPLCEWTSEASQALGIPKSQWAGRRPQVLRQGGFCGQKADPSPVLSLAILEKARRRPKAAQTSHPQDRPLPLAILHNPGGHPDFPSHPGPAACRQHAGCQEGRVLPHPR